MWKRIIPGYLAFKKREKKTTFQYSMITRCEIVQDIQKLFLEIWALNYM